MYVRFAGWVSLMLIHLFSFGQEKEKVETSLVIESETALELNGVEIQKSELILTPELSYKIGKNFKIVGIGRFYGEWTDSFEPGVALNDNAFDFSRRLDLGDRAELEIREFYVDYWNSKGLSFRVGKQQIAWGETDGLKLLDVVNPQYFREFILDDFDESRIPLWSVKTEFPIFKNLDAQVIWIPDQTYHNIPSFDGTYFPEALVPLPPPGILAEFSPVNKPNRFIEDGDIGFKLSSFLGGWDVTLNYLYHYDDLPNFYLSPIDNQTIQVDQRYNRLHLLGATFNKAIGSFVLRGETAFNVNRNISTENFEDNQGVSESNQILNTIGLDWISGDWTASFQIFNDYLFSDIDPFNRDDLEVNWTFLASRKLFYENLELEVLLIQNINDGDWLIRPKSSYLLTSNFKMRLGADIFEGPSRGLFGQFDTRDRIYLGLEWGL